MTARCVTESTPATGSISDGILRESSRRSGDDAMELSPNRPEMQALHEHLPARRGCRFIREIEGFG